MKIILNNIMAAAIICCIFLFAGCPNSAIPKTDINSNAPLNPQRQPGDLLKEDIMSAFALTKGNITASNAAKKIRDTDPSEGSVLTFTEKAITAYDDKAGTFTVKVKGTKGEKSFEKELTFTGFENPYAKIFPSLSAVELDFSEAIEHNKTLDTFISDAAGNSALLKKLSFSDDNTGTLSLGVHDRYSLAAALEKNGDKIKIIPVYKVKYLKKEAGESETSTETDRSALFARLGADLTKPYFSKEDVFRYLINKTDDGIINVSADVFGSEYYAFAKRLRVTPARLINDAHIQTIMTRYNREGGQFNMEMDTALFHPENEGIKADDIEGTLEITYCIAEKEQIAEMLSSKPDPSVRRITVTKTAKAAGFKKIPKDNIASLFNFSVKVKDDANSRQKWQHKVFENYRFLSEQYDTEREMTMFALENPLQKTAASVFYLEVNGREPEDVLAFNEPISFSKTADGKHIFIKYVYLNKESGSDKLKVHINFTGEGEEIALEVSPEYVIGN
ncbi:hypothetical protein E4O05_01900 [Treponema sp. OMZ 787]|uniref:lipoprotein 17-related variable surface protein n=1 Tax=Treponema sp. OMZ 787 TaxID=2563669 RepID=UPI0020A3FF00|nr:lipoprotein 17-related variable surface protein [Treponema sp. OMZ 787]UTC62677.1 hypothetical protein E4O05_01900 [Treponema sp. OMZ 787]